jgi:hypothetical protein
MTRYETILHEAPRGGSESLGATRYTTGRGNHAQKPEIKRGIDPLPLRSMMPHKAQRYATI